MFSFWVSTRFLFGADPTPMNHEKCVAIHERSYK